MELKSGATFDAKIKDVDEKADIALIKIDTPVSTEGEGWREGTPFKLTLKSHNFKICFAVLASLCIKFVVNSRVSTARNLWRNSLLRGCNFQRYRDRGLQHRNISD